MGIVKSINDRLIDDYLNADEIWSIISKIDWSSKIVVVPSLNIVFRLVDGDEVKVQYDMDFVEGGSNSRYWFIPFNEIWIDYNIDSHDYYYIALHETIERIIMFVFGLDYDDAHKIANYYEKKFRSAT